MSASNGMDNILSGVIGALQGAQAGIQPYAQMNLYKAQKQFENQNNLDYMNQALPIQNRNEMDMFRQKLPLETQSKIDIANATPTNIISPTGEVLGTFKGKGLKLPYAPGSGSKIDTRTIGQLKASGEGNTVPTEFQNTQEFDSYRVPEATTMLQMRGNQSLRSQGNEISAGKTGIFQGIRNATSGIPGFGGNSQSSVPAIGSQFGGAKVMKVIKIK